MITIEIIKTGDCNHCCITENGDDDRKKWICRSKEILDSGGKSCKYIKGYPNYVFKDEEYRFMMMLVHQFFPKLKMISKNKSTTKYKVL